MHSFLLEILCEEIPSRMQNYARYKFNEALIKNVIAPLKINESNLQIFTTPRRIAILISNMPQKQQAKVVEKKGPAKNSSPETIAKFLLSNNKQNQDLYYKTVNNKEYCFIQTEHASIDVKDFLKESVEKILQNFHWPNPMRWGCGNLEWIRPIKSIACILDGELVPLQFYHYKSCKETFGNRILAKDKKLTIVNAEKYKELLKQIYVILDQEERKAIILDQVKNLEGQNKISVNINPKLLEEVVGIIEWPHCILGSFDKDFLQLPATLIVNVIEKHQKIFPVFCNEIITNKFVVVTNFNNDSVRAGYEKVISARLHDAKSMIEHDTKKNLQSYVEQLCQITFHQKLGSFYEKTQRITSLAKFISFWVPNASIVKVEKAAELCKADLCTSAVKEFPEMAGLIGAHYLELENEKDIEILSAIKSHNMPTGAEDGCPTEPAAIAISIADKIDNITGFFSVAEKITSAKDPLGIRRNTICVLRTILKNKIDISLRVVIMRSIDLYPQSLFCSLIEKIGFKPDEEKQRKNHVISLILDFLQERLGNLLEREGFDDAIISSSKEEMDRPVLMHTKCSAITAFVKTDNGKSFLNSIKRVYNILQKNKEFVSKIKQKYSRKIFVEQEEVLLADSVEDTSSMLDTFLKEDNFVQALTGLTKITSSLDIFMNRIMINCEEEDVKKNRFGLLLFLWSTLNASFKFESFFVK